jgi:hypothetical protein
MTFQTSPCATCQAAVIWAETEAGKRMPVDPEPAAKGNVRLHERPDDVPLAVVLKPADLFGKTGLHLSHFVTCPDADTFRRRPRPRRPT